MDAGSLSDGSYTFSIASRFVRDLTGNALDGNLDGRPLDDRTTAFHRLFGDGDGDGDVDNTDFVAFRLAFGNGPSIFDADGDGDTDNADFVAFRGRFGTTLPLGVATLKQLLSFALPA